MAIIVAGRFVIARTSGGGCSACKAAKAPPGLSPARWVRAGLADGPAHSLFCLRLRDQMRVKVSPSASSNRLA
jgi:hypothetical protein